MNSKDNIPVHPLKRLKEQAEEIKQKREKEKVHCPECGTTVWKESVEEAIDTAEKHDEQRHDGEATTKVNGLTPPSFTEEEKEQIQNAVETLKGKVNDESS